MLTAQVENPMVSGYWQEKAPDVVCPHCGAEWMLLSKDHAQHVMAASGQYCLDCLEAACGTDQALLNWYSQDVDKGDLLHYYFRDAYGHHYSGTDPDVLLLLDMLQEHRPDTFLELLRDYSRNDSRPGRANGWMDYLKQHN